MNYTVNKLAKLSGVTIRALRLYSEQQKKYEKESYAGHADLILQTDLKKTYASYHPELAQFISDAIKVFAHKKLQSTLQQP